MKITFVTPPPNLSGGIRVIAIYAERLRRRGHEVLVVHPPHQRHSLLQGVKALARGRGWPSQPSARSHFDGTGVPQKVLDRYRPLTDADVPDSDVIVATWWETAEWVAGLSASKGAKAYFLQHHETFEYLPKERVAATWRLPMHKITISRWLVELAASEYGDRDVSFVPNSVDTELFFAPPRGKQPVPTVGLLYSRAYWKGCTVSLRAFALAAARLPRLRLVSFGSHLPSAELPLPPQTQFVHKPPQPTIKDLYAQCDVWLCGSWSEGFHLPPLEAMACRCPVISTAVGGPLDVVEDGHNGYVVPLGDSAALAERLVEVLSLSEVRWQAMSDAAYETAVRYTWDDATDRFEAALQTASDRTHQEVGA